MRHATFIQHSSNGVHPLYHHAAESLIETMVAVTVIALATAGALAILRISLEGNEDIGNKVVALNLAEEAFEALRNIRDTNYLLFAADPDNCWNKYDVTDVNACSDGSAPEITDGETYYLDRSYTSYPLFEWTLAEVTYSDIHGRLSLYNVDADGDRDTDAQIYAKGNLNETAYTTEVKNAFKRQISIDYETSGNAYDATVTITWTEHGVEKVIALTRSIAHVY